MKISTLIFGAAGAYLLWYITNLGTAANTIAIVLKDVIVNNPLSYTVILTVQNITNAAATVNSMSGELNLNSNPLASISDFTQRIIPANGQVDIPVTVNVSLLDLRGAIQTLITGGVKILNFNATGNVNLSGLILPFDLNNTITLP